VTNPPFEARPGYPGAPINLERAARDFAVFQCRRNPVSLTGKIASRLRSEDAFTLIELLIVMQLLGILMMIGTPAFLSFRGKADADAAQQNVRGAIVAAEGYNQANSGTPTDADNNAGTTQYAGMTRALLLNQTASLDPGLVTSVSTSGASYCLQDTVGAITYHYVGGADANVLPNGGTVAIASCPSLP
jgi:prepilin-type N-terminal cleavage/methylation domain-containing protein